MKRAHILPSLLVVAISITPAAAQEAPFSEAINVKRISRDRVGGPNGSQADTQVEPDIAMDPNDPARLLAAFQQGRFIDGGSLAPGYATSHDGGATWTSDELPNLTTATGGDFPRASDPVAAFGPDGSAYVQTLVVDLEACRTGVAVQRSSDGGLSFGDPVLVQDETNCGVFNDKNWLAVDTFSSSPHAGRLYSVWSRNFRIALRHSDDSGQTWSDLVFVSGGGNNAIGAIPVVQPSGDLTVVYLRADEGSFAGSVVAATSHDGGVTFDAPVAVSTARGAPPSDMRAPLLPSAAVDPTTGELFAAWQDDRFAHEHGLNDIVLFSSLDGGATWSGEVRVNPDPLTSRRDHFTADVAAHSGTVHVTYTTRWFGKNRYSRFAKQRYVVSIDGGDSFGDEVTLGPRINLRWAARAGSSKFLADYVGIAAGADSAHPVWPRASRDPGGDTKRHQTTWSATIPR